MITIRVMVRPMNNTALNVPLIHPVKLNKTSDLQIRYSFCNINIVSYEYCLLRAYSQYKPLVTRHFEIVRQSLVTTPFPCI